MHYGNHVTGSISFNLHTAEWKSFKVRKTKH